MKSQTASVTIETTNTSTPLNGANGASRPSKPKKTPPAFALYSVEEQALRPADKAKAERQGRKVAENATRSVWTKVGVAFPTKSGSGSMTLLIGERGDPKQKRYLLCPTSALDAKDPESRIPVGQLFELTDEPINFKNKDGVAFLNRDESYSLIIGDRGDLQQVRLNMRREDRQQKRA